MSQRFATFISYLFHPMLLPSYGTVLIIWANPHLFGAYKLKGQLLWLIIVFIMTFIFPAVWLVLMKRLQLINDFLFENAKDRIIPYIAIATFYLWTFKLFKPTVELTPYSNQLISLMMLGSAITIFIGFFVNIFRKISLHAMGAGAMAGLVLSLIRIADFDLRLVFMIVLLLGGIIGTARLLLKAHEPREIWWGYGAGFIGQFIAWVLVGLSF